MDYKDFRAVGKLFPLLLFFRTPEQGYPIYVEAAGRRFMILAVAIIIFAILLASGAPIFMAFAIGGIIIITLHTGLPLYNIGIFFFDSIPERLFM